MQQFSLLDLSPIPEGKTAAAALSNTADLACAAEKAGYYRYWLAEHHNMPASPVPRHLRLAEPMSSPVERLGKIDCKRRSMDPHRPY